VTAPDAARPALSPFVPGDNEEERLTTGGYDLDD
jgi:hypothetical protein